MANKGQGVVEFSGGTVNDLLSHLLTQHGLTWADFPLLEKWEESINIFILHNDSTLIKTDYRRKPLADGAGSRCTSTLVLLNEADDTVLGRSLLRR